MGCWSCREQCRRSVSADVFPVWVGPKEAKPIGLFPTLIMSSAKPIGLFPTLIMSSDLTRSQRLRLQRSQSYLGSLTCETNRMITSFQKVFFFNLTRGHGQARSTKVNLSQMGIIRLHESWDYNGINLFFYSSNIAPSIINYSQKRISA